MPHEVGGKEYRNHLFVSDITGVATMKLNTWEAGVIEEEEKREDLSVGFGILPEAHGHFVFLMKLMVK